MLCPCESHLSYDECCGPFINQLKLPSNPEALMRSRYTAFTRHDVNYLKNTMRGKALQNFTFDGFDAWLNTISWQGLTIIKSIMKNKNHGFVTFEARYLENNQMKIIREKSEFKKLAAQWFYIDGVLY